MGAVIEVSFRRHRDELVDSWQGRVVRLTCYADFDLVRPKGRIGLTALSVLAHNFDDAMPVLLTAVFPSYRGCGTPMLCSAAKVAKSGHVMADLIRFDGTRVGNQMLFRSLEDMQNRYRELADELFFCDEERVALFAAVKNWVVCDYRLDPNFDRRDPDAKRLTVN